MSLKADAMSTTCRVELEKCHDAGLTPTQFSFLYCLFYQKPFPWKIPKSQREALEEAGWIKITPKGIALREKFAEFLGLTAASTEEVDEWIDSWRELWPAGVKSGGRPVKGDKRGCAKKMASFIRDHEYSKEEIFEATRIYLFDKRRDNYRFITCADYFINKSGSSILASICEDIRERGSSLKDAEEGGSAFMKEI